jgi:hypothetical protein
LAIPTKKEIKEFWRVLPRETFWLEKTRGLIISRTVCIYIQTSAFGDERNKKQAQSTIKAWLISIIFL